MRKNLLAGALTIAFLLLLSSCGLGPDQNGKLEADKLSVEGCGEFAPFELKLDFVGYDECGELLYFRFQKGGRFISESDGVSLHLADPEALQQAVSKGPVLLELPSDGASLSVYLNQKCPDAFVSLVAQNGQLELTELDLGKDGSLVLSAAFELADEKTGNVVSTGMNLTLDAELAEI